MAERHTAYRSETVEVFLYAQAMRQAQRAMEDGAALSPWLARMAHGKLLAFGRGADLSPGQFKTEQTYIIDRIRRKVLFVPIRPEQLQDGLDRLFSFMAEEREQILIRTALAHLEFEALHPFKDGNGRIGRMLITLMLWHQRVISAPHFYVSSYFERHKDEYIDRMRAVSADDQWTEWTAFFLEALRDRADHSLALADRIAALYEDMKDRFRETLSSQWSTAALDFLFARPAFRGNVFARESGIPPSTATRFPRALAEAGLLRILRPAAGRRAALYSFEPLLEVVRG